MQNVKWGNYVLRDLFEINNTLSFNKNKLTIGSEYDYITRTSQNQGILQESGFVNHENINPAGTWSLGLLQMDFFYRERPWYAGQFVRKVTPKVELTKSAILYLTTLLNKQKKNLLSGLVRDVDKAFLNAEVQLPTKNGKIDFEFMESFIAELEAQRIAELEAYLLVTGLKDYILTAEEQQALDNFEKETYSKFLINSIFEKLNLKNHNKSFDKLTDTSTTKTNEFNLPLVNAKLGHNGIMFYGREKDFDSAEMTIDVISNGAVATGTVYAQPYKTGVLWDAYLLKPIAQDMSKQKLLYMATALQKSIKTKFGWEDKAVWSKVQHETISLPTINSQPDYGVMETFISAVQKLVIKDVVLYADKKIAATKKVVNI